MRKGFTLVELAIVLVIIGLIIGGILAAKSMSETAKILQLNQEFEQHITNIRIFKERFRNLPGDMPNASTILGSTFNGNGNGEISCCTANYEGPGAWNHMYRAGLYTTAYQANWPSAGLTNPGSKYAKGLAPGDDVAVYDFGPDGKGYNTLELGTIPSDHSFRAQINPGITTLIGQALDSKFDDGNPYTGKILAGPNAYYSDIWGCTTSGKYNVNLKTGLCAPSYKFDDTMP